MRYMLMKAQQKNQNQNEKERKSFQIKPLKKRNYRKYQDFLQS